MCAGADGKAIDVHTQSSASLVELGDIIFHYEGNMIRNFLAAALTFGAMLVALPAHAQYPTQPIKFVIPWGAGGSADALGRVYAEALSRQVGQPVIVENRPGAASNIGSEFVARQPGDGYTMLNASSAFATNVSLYKSIPYDPVKDFKAVAILSAVPNVLVVHPSVPAKNVAELIAYAKANPGKVNFASSGNGTTPHLSAELFKQATGVDIVHVPYRTEANATTDLIGGQVQMMFQTTPSALPHIRSGATRALMITATERLKGELPDVPTSVESGLPKIISASWTSILVPAATPDAIVQRLNSEFAKASADPVVIDRLNKMGAQIMSGSPAQVDAFIKGEIEKWGNVVRTVGIKID
jgi:tripartite-type tricarboxylate transporter receptor subunit TctC